MAVWTFETDSGFTEFDFPLSDDKNFFHELVKDYFEKSQPVLEKWRPLILITGEPMKHPDFFSIDHGDVIAISQRGVDLLNEFFKDKIELLPLETDAGRYYAINVLNIVDCLDKDESKYTATKGGTIVTYSLLEFDDERLGENAIFKIPEMPYQTFVTTDIQYLVAREFVKGLFFDPKINLVAD